ncbi:MAG: hypothetical protein A2128_00850 [Candidatus Liptonbacteria bacterium GWC1_60_9]|uniref:Uncharacterized protein n=3 Tax=Candidatus Liptoniibacteriota TaxID=1817909 RepID=A0A1G2CQA2_9BACT|nr:MAG: hypothetical protein A2128_00850 [Candidatus Liptonbacteria bacterium GWC1_60_9]OGY99126.1 MAG: hypothetical protein A3E09_01525 [Candidatus Liptonbacteria bacterium RIFCSPHIGHO2_12_FULL_60_13]OGZ02811.1 MAG: hypothetical protein A3G64_02370 [Candidatus Liptonbacteria bacterium RIFCSPLOWO2_12_FULL_60_15]
MRRIFVRAKPGAKRPEIEKIDEAHYAVAVREPAREGKANRAIEAALAEHFGVPSSRVEIVSGHHGRVKVVEIVG